MLHCTKLVHCLIARNRLLRIGESPSPSAFSPRPSINFPSSSIMAFSRVTSFICLLFATTALAHGGHEAVPEGEAISLEPIVCHAPSPPSGDMFCNLTSRDNTNYFRNLGLHSMGSYDSYGLFFWNYLSFGYGSGCMFYSSKKIPFDCYLESNADLCLPWLYRLFARDGTSLFKLLELSLLFWLIFSVMRIRAVNSEKMHTPLSPTGLCSSSLRRLFWAFI